MQKLVGATFVALMLVAPVSAEATPPRMKEKQTYTNLRNAVKKRFGPRLPGRNIRAYGVKTSKGSRPATANEISRSIRTFRRWLAPPAPVAKVGDTISRNPVKAGGRWAIPSYIVMCESGGNYSARNPSGAGGAYQIMPGTFHAYGGRGDPASAPPSEQDAVAAKIYAAEGASPWVCG